MQNNIPLPWAVAAIVVVVLIIGVVIWRSQSPQATAYNGPNIPTVNSYRGQFQNQPPR